MKHSASKYQKDIARCLGISIDEDSFFVAAAQLASVMGSALWLDVKPNEPATPKQISYASILGIDVSADVKIVASARIQEKQLERSKLLINEMGLKPGSKVYSRKHDREMTISSIAKNGRLWFKGGNGYGAFPHQVEPSSPQANLLK